MHDNTDVLGQIAQLIEELTIEEKVALLTGADNNFTISKSEIGLRPILMSNGPAGVRGPSWHESHKSINLPSPTNLAATWSHEIAAEYGAVLAREALRRGVDVVLGPTVNMHRTPFSGRNFEGLSEDPLLTGQIAKALIAEMQSHGVAACIKHYVCNDFETDRFTANVHVSERALREVYLRPFEDAVVEAGAWSLMSAYNMVNGESATESTLLTHPLRSEWNFDGLTVGDWTAVRTLESAKHDQDLVMPGPAGPWGDALVAAVESGEISSSIVDRKVERLLLLAHRVGAIDFSGSTPAPKPKLEIDPTSDECFAYSCAVESQVLLKNSGILPIDVTKAKRIAIVGELAAEGRTQGGGSAAVIPKQVVNILDSFLQIEGLEVAYSVGARVHEGLAPVAIDFYRNPETKELGLRAEFFSDNGNLLFVDHRTSMSPVWVGGDAPTRESTTLKLSFLLKFNRDTQLDFGFASGFGADLAIDGQTHLSVEADTSGFNLKKLLHPPITTAGFEFLAETEYLVEVTVDMRGRHGRAQDYFAFQLGFAKAEVDPTVLIRDAVESAKTADSVIVAVGTNTVVESEGFDRESLELPGYQNALVEAILEVNPNVIAVVNAGSPVELPWREKVKAILVAHLPGQEMGYAIRDVLIGHADPGGRLPATWPATADSLPIENVYPDAKGQMHYSEGIHVGYRAWLHKPQKPAFWFGQGLSYATFSTAFLGAQRECSSSATTLNFEVSNSSDRPGSHVLQIFCQKKDSNVSRPERWLVGFKKVSLAAGQSAKVGIQITDREFMYWTNGWHLEPGSYQLCLGLEQSEPFETLTF